MSFLQGLFGPPNVEKMKARRDVEGLIRALTYRRDSIEHDDSDMRRTAGKALGELGDARAVEPLITALNDRSVAVRDAAAEALGAIGDPRAIEPLIDSLSRITDASQAAAEALGKFGRPAVERLIARIADSYGGEYASSALVKMGEPAVDSLLAALQDVSMAIRLGAAKALGEIGDARAVEPLIAMLNDSNIYVCRAAAEALGEIGNARALEPLLFTLRHNYVREAAEALDRLGWHPGEDEDGASYWIAKKRLDKCIEIGKPAVGPLIAAFDEYSDMREGAIEALGLIGSACAVESLIVALKDGSTGTRQAAVKALGVIGDARAADPLIAALKDIDLRNTAVEALVKIGKPAVESLLDAIRDDDKGTRHAATLALVDIGIPAIEPLITTLNDRDRAVRQAAAEALDRLGWRPGEDQDGARYWLAKKRWDKCLEIGKPAVEPLVAEIGGFYTSEAAEALGVIGDARAVEPLITALEGNGGCRETALALGKIGDPRAVEPLITALKYRSSPELRQAAAEALGKLGKPAVEHLILALNESDRYVRQLAAEALGKTGDTRAVQPLIAEVRSSYTCEAAEALDRLGWHPGEDEDGAGYWLAKERLDKYHEIFEKIGAPAIEPLCTALKQAALASPPRPVSPMPGAYIPGEHLYWEHVRFREAMVSVLGHIADARAVETLTWISHHDPHAIDLLENEEIAARDDRWPVREAAQAALQKIADNGKRM